MECHFFEYYYTTNNTFKSFDRDLNNSSEWKLFENVLENTKEPVYLFISKSTINNETQETVFIREINKYKTTQTEVASFIVFQFN